MSVMKRPSVTTKPSVPEFLSGGGELGQMIREYDWSNTSLGPVDTWPHSLRTCIRIMLTSRQPIWIGWGRELIKLYNDPYKSIVGGKHPWALGKSASVVWKDIWREIDPLLRQVMENDEGTYVESQLLIMERNGYPEETYYTFSYTPIPGDNGGTVGMICANTDDTERIISERQLKTLTQLGAKLTDAQSSQEIIGETIATLSENQYDFPFTLFYLIGKNKALLSTQLGDAGHSLPKVIDLDAETELSGLLREAAVSRKLQVLKNVSDSIGTMPGGAWEVSPDNAIILPVAQAGAKDPYGFLIVGCNPYRLLDDKYRGFFSLVADQVATSFSNVHVLEEERKRAEALAEIDRAKTTFFSNISHEFRTPLTLLLGPIEDALNNPGAIEDNKVRMDVAHRNALRMQKLVNTLLEFSRIEAGRTEGRYMLTDIGHFTEDLASTFRSAIEKAGMSLEVAKKKIRDKVYVDPDMWEKIILNLVSNAFKYSQKGTIRIETGQTGNSVYAVVSDTGIGIADDQLDKIFNRFHRVENTEGRSQEGTGIGLAMVKELVKLHGGDISVSSKVGKGSVFTVRIPSGRRHLPSDRVVESGDKAPRSRHSAAFVQEAAKWLPIDAPVQMDGKLTILLAEDNADMRDYVQRLLSGQYTVITAADGESAYDKALRHKPELVISDVMMPKLDGFGLLRKIRANADLRNTPVLFLSARAGEESKVEGLDAGADDYLVKPFSARELAVRVSNHIRLNLRRKKVEESEKRLDLEVRERTQELRQLNIALQKSNDDLQQFAHVASHDLKEPVRKIKTFSNRLVDEYGESIPGRGMEFLGKILHATDRIMAMIDGVLNYSTLNAAEQPVESIDLNETFDNIEADLEILIQQKNAEFKRGALCRIDGAPVLIYQLFYNLVNNALKFSKTEGRPVITVTSENVHEEGKDMAKIIIADNGIGFDQTDAGAIFNIFTRLNAKDRYEGTGLGLSLCKRIAERHGGRIEAAGEKDKGATFTIWLQAK